MQFNTVLLHFFGGGALIGFWGDKPPKQPPDHCPCQGPALMTRNRPGCSPGCWDTAWQLLVISSTNKRTTNYSAINDLFVDEITAAIYRKK